MSENASGLERVGSPLTESAEWLLCQDRSRGGHGRGGLAGLSSLFLEAPPRKQVKVLLKQLSGARSVHEVD